MALAGIVAPATARLAELLEFLERQHAVLVRVEPIEKAIQHLLAVEPVAGTARTTRPTAFTAWTSAWSTGATWPTTRTPARASRTARAARTPTGASTRLIPRLTTRAAAWPGTGQGLHDFAQLGELLPGQLTVARCVEPLEKGLGVRAAPGTVASGIVALRRVGRLVVGTGDGKAQPHKRGQG